MPGITRRRFLRDASLGAAAVGTVAKVGPSVHGAATASGAAASTLTSSEKAHELAASRGPETEIMAHVVDRSSGTISLYSGTKKVTFQDKAVANALVKALQ